MKTFSLPYRCTDLLHDGTSYVAACIKKNIGILYRFTAFDSPKEMYRYQGVGVRGFLFNKGMMGFEAVSYRQKRDVYKCSFRSGNDIPTIMRYDWLHGKGYTHQYTEIFSVGSENYEIVATNEVPVGLMREHDEMLFTIPPGWDDWNEMALPLHSVIVLGKNMQKTKKIFDNLKDERDKFVKPAIDSTEQTFAIATRSGKVCILDLDEILAFE